MASSRRNIVTASSLDEIDAFVGRLRAAVEEKERMPDRQELMELIESGKHVLVGAKALAYYTDPRFTEDSDYIVDGKTFQRIRKWAADKGIPVEDLGLVLRLRTLAVDVIDARSNAVLKEILKHESAKPSPEALAAAKYVSFVNQTRGRRRIRDVSDFSDLVVLKDFSLDKMKTYMVAEYESQWPDVVKLVEDIKAGRPITI